MDRDTPWLADDVFCGQNQLFPFDEGHPAFAHLACAQLGPLQVRQNGDRLLELFCDDAHAFDRLSVIFMRAMAHVEASHVHAGFGDATQNGELPTGRADCADNFDA